MKDRLTFFQFINCARGASAVEFAIIFPLLLMTLFGIILFGSYLAVVHGVQQLAAEAARASVAGLTDAERAGLARGNVAANAASYPFIEPDQLAVVRAATEADGHTFRVSLRYDASRMFVFNLPRFVPMPSPLIERSSAIQRGGY